MDIQFTDQGEESPSVVVTEKFVQKMKIPKNSMNSHKKKERENISSE